MKTKILVVDDDGDEAELLRDLLLRRGYDASFVVRPELALAAIATHEVAVVVTDVRMQGMSGIEPANPHDACGSNRSRAAKVLGIDRRSLFRRLQEPAADPA
jgi:DNA-binding NtrC family response regulator